MHLRNSILASSNICLFLSSPNRKLCSLIPQKCYTSWANLKWSPSKLFLVWTSTCCAQIAIIVSCVLLLSCGANCWQLHSGLIYLCKYIALFPAWATKSRLAEHHVHWRQLLWWMCMAEREEFRFFGFVHDKLKVHNLLDGKFWKAGAQHYLKGEQQHDWLIRCTGTLPGWWQTVVTDSFKTIFRWNF